MKSLSQRMCVVNPALVDDIAPLAGGQSSIMLRIGISWNTWTKIAGGLPIRHSVAQRLKSRIVAQAAEIESFGDKFPTASGGVDREALDAAFFLTNVPAPRRHRAHAAPVEAGKKSECPAT